jgi:hypothetical protein
MMGITYDGGRGRRVAAGVNFTLVDGANLKELI